MTESLRPQIADRMRGMSEQDAYELSVQLTSTLARGLGSLSGVVREEHPAHKCAERLRWRLRELADQAESRAVGAPDLIEVIVATANELWRIAAFQGDPRMREQLLMLARPICDRPEVVVSRCSTNASEGISGAKNALVALDAGGRGACVVEFAPVR
jgi:hypothetical protein